MALFSPIRPAAERYGPAKTGLPQANYLLPRHPRQVDELHHRPQRPALVLGAGSQPRPFSWCPSPSAQHMTTVNRSATRLASIRRVPNATSHGWAATSEMNACVSVAEVSSPNPTVANDQPACATPSCPRAYLPNNWTPERRGSRGRDGTFPSEASQAALYDSRASLSSGSEAEWHCFLQSGQQRSVSAPPKRVCLKPIICCRGIRGKSTNSTTVLNVLRSSWVRAVSRGPFHGAHRRPPNT